MFDPLTFCIIAAANPALISAGAEAVKAAAGGVIGNLTHDGLKSAVGLIRHRLQTAGAPTNHHLQRALRIAYLQATRRLLCAVAPPERLSVTDNSAAWCQSALAWVDAQLALIKDESAPPSSIVCDLALLVVPDAPDAAEAVRSLRDALCASLLAEWQAAGLGAPPPCVEQALTNGFQIDHDGQPADWFGLLALLFAEQTKQDPVVQAAFQNAELSQIHVELRAFRAEARAAQAPVRKHFYAPSNPDVFIGRTGLLDTLAARLAEPGAVVPLTGMPGLGKTLLAIRFAHAHRNAFDAVYWASCAGASLLSPLAELYRQLEIRPDGDEAAQLADLRHHLASRRALLVLDNVENEHPGQLIPAGLCSTLVTTRHINLHFLDAHQPPDLRLFTKDESLALFRERLGAAVVARDEGSYANLAARFGHLPYALAVAAGLLHKDLRYSVSRLLAEAQPHRLAHGALDISVLLNAAVASASEPARRLLAAMAVCAPSGFRLSLAAEVAGMAEPDSLDALQDLHSRSLIEIVDRDQHRYRLHSLLRSSVGQSPELQQTHARAVAARFEHWETEWQACEQDLDDWRTAFAWAAEHAPEDAAIRSIMAALSYSGFRLTERRGLLADALALLKKVEDVYVELGDRAGRSTSCGHQAIILRIWGRLDEAMALHKKKEAICLELGDRTGLQASYGNQALILQVWGRLDDAMALHKKKEAICVELGDRVGLSTSYGNQSLILKAWGRLDEAMALHKKEEAICVELGDRAGLEASYGNQALILKAWGRLDEAMALHKKEEAICVELGDRAGLQASYGNQALILQDWGRLDEAMALHKKKEAICVELGDRAGLQRSYGNQALILQAWGRLDEAMALHKKKEAICVELGDRAGLQRSYGNQALILQDWGRLDEAMELLKKQEAICRELGLRDDLRICLHNQAIVLDQLGDSAAAARPREEEAAIQADLDRRRDAPPDA